MGVGGLTVSQGSNRGRRLVDRVTAPGFVEGLEEAPLPAVLERIRICSELDLEYSYYRRLLQGRVDILAHELARRAGDEPRDLLEALPEILARAGEPDGDVRFRRSHLLELLEDHLPVEVHALIESLFPRDPMSVAPEWIPEAGRRAIDRLLGDDILPRLGRATDEELQRAAADLTAAEQEISSIRRRVLDAADTIERIALRRLKAPLTGSSLVHTAEWVCDAYLRQLTRGASSSG